MTTRQKRRTKARRRAKARALAKATRAQLAGLDQLGPDVQAQAQRDALDALDTAAYARATRQLLDAHDTGDPLRLDEAEVDALYRGMRAVELHRRQLVDSTNMLTYGLDRMATPDCGATDAAHLWQYTRVDDRDRFTCTQCGEAA